MKYELSIAAAAKKLGVGESRVSQLVSSGVLDSVTIRGNRRISAESVDAYAANRRTRGRVPLIKRPSVQKYILMNADYEVMQLFFDERAELPLSAGEIYDTSRAPISVLTSGGLPKKRKLNDWWLHRSIPATRPGLEGKLSELGVGSTAGLPLKNLGLSLSDCYWLRPMNSPDIEWSQVNYFDNDFFLSCNQEWQDWLGGIGVDSPDNTSEGELPKKWVITEGVRTLIKGSRHDDQRPYNEIVATMLQVRLLDDNDFVRYELVSTADGVACSCENFLSGREEYIPATYVKEIMRSTRGTSSYDRFCRFCSSLGMDEKELREKLSKMIVCDYILANNDRHWRNFGFIRNVDTLEMRIAPIFDSGNCLWYGKTQLEVERGDYGYVSRPFDTTPERQLALADELSWFEGDSLEDFVEDVLTILARSNHVSKGERLEYIEKGLRDRIVKTTVALSILQYR